MKHFTIICDMKERIHAEQLLYHYTLFFIKKLTLVHINFSPPHPAKPQQPAAPLTDYHLRLQSKRVAPLQGCNHYAGGAAATACFFFPHECTGQPPEPIQ